MKTFRTTKNDGTVGPRIKAPSYDKAKEYLKLLQSNKETYTITGEEVIIQLQ